MSALERLRIAVVGGGPAGLYFAYLWKSRHPRAQLRVYEQTRREFASDVSHELHSLASAMQTAAEALERGAAESNPALGQRLVGGLVGHTRRLTRLADYLPGTHAQRQDGAGRRRRDPAMGQLVLGLRQAGLAGIDLGPSRQD